MLHWRTVCDSGDFVCLVGEREKECETPSDVGELTALWAITIYAAYIPIDFVRMIEVKLTFDNIARNTHYHMLCSL